MNGDSMTSGWYYSKAGVPSGQQVGPLSWAALCSLTQTGTLTPTDLVCNPQLSQWTPAAQTQGLFPAAGFPGGQTPCPAAYAAPRRRSWLAWAIPVAVLVLAGLGLGLGCGTATPESEGSNTNAATTARAQKDVVPLGQEAQVGDWKVKVTAVTLDATQVVMGSASMNPTPPSGSQYVLVKLEVTHTRESEYNKYTGAQDWAFVGNGGKTFKYEYALVPDDLFSLGDTLPGATASGNLAFMVDSDQVSGGVVSIDQLYAHDPVFFAID